jgi:hypothetical protein
MKKTRIISAVYSLSLIILIGLSFSPTVTAQTSVNTIPSTGTINSATHQDTYYSGISGYTTGIAGVDQIVSFIKTNNLNVWRASFTPSWKSGGNHAYDPARIQRFLDTCSANVIVDINHLYPPNADSDADAVNHWTDVENSVMNVLQQWKNNPRVWIEPINEYTSLDSSLPDFYDLMQPLVTKIRQAGYTNPIVCDKMYNPPWKMINDPLNLTYQGYHNYMNEQTLSSIFSKLNAAQSAGIKLFVCTEVGASYNEYSDFTATNVGNLQTYLDQCADMGIGNTVWMREDLQNWVSNNGYGDYGLSIPNDY